MVGKCVVHTQEGTSSPPSCIQLVCCIVDTVVSPCVVLTLYVFGICFLTAIVFVVHVYPDQGQSVFLASVGIAFGESHQAESPIKYK
jgi:hypothetical protein